MALPWRRSYHRLLKLESGPTGERGSYVLKVRRLKEGYTRLVAVGSAHGGLSSAVRVLLTNGQGEASSEDAGPIVLSMDHIAVVHVRTDGHVEIKAGDGGLSADVW